jgi:hypothetical protein
VARVFRSGNFLLDSTEYSRTGPPVQTRKSAAQGTLPLLAAGEKTNLGKYRTQQTLLGSLHESDSFRTVLLHDTGRSE